MRFMMLYKPGHENDIMGDVFKGSEKLQQFDVDKFAAAGAKRLTVEAKPGDLLLNKDGGAQNLAVGAPFELTTELGKPAHADGLVGYCIDLHHHVPSAGQGFDVLGSAGAQPQPALQYLQLEAASQTHSEPGIFQKAGQFPSAEPIDLPLSDDARQYYKTGPPFLMRYLPFWVAIMAGRLLVILIPVIGIIFPLMRFIPALYGWIIRRRIFRLYG